MKINNIEKKLLNLFSWFVIISFILAWTFLVKDSKKWDREASETREWRKSVKKGDTTDISIPQYIKSRVVIDSVYNDTVLIHLVTEKDYLYKIK